MAPAPSIIDGKPQKRIKVNQVQRRALIPSLQLAGLTQEEIASRLGVSRSCIVRDLADLHPVAKAETDKLRHLVDEITSVLPVEQRAQKYANLAMKAKNEAVSLGALQRIDDLDGIVTEKERIRAKGHEVSEPQPMFVLPPGANVSVTIHQQRTTISSEAAGIHKTSTAPFTTDTTTNRHDISSHDIDE